MGVGKGTAIGAAALLAVPLLVIVAGNSKAVGAYCSVTIADQSTEAATVGGVQLDQEQTANAKVIVKVAQGLHLPTRAAAIALMTAMQESSLRTPGPYAGHDAAGLFQQRSIMGWGTPQQVMDPVYAANAFLKGVPGPPPIPGLTSVQGWEQMDMADAAEIVQVSGEGYQYRKWADFGTKLAAALSGGNGAGVTCTDGAPASLSGPAVSNVINRAMGQLNVPYVWGGGTPSGPSVGFCGEDAGWLNGECFAGSHAGFDCSSLVQYAWWPYVHLPRVTTDQYEAGAHVPTSQAAPGDLVFWYSAKNGIYHVALVVKGGPELTIIEAPRTGLSVRVRQLKLSEDNLMSTAVRLSAPNSGSPAPS